MAVVVTWVVQGCVWVVRGCAVALGVLLVSLKTGAVAVRWTTLHMDGTEAADMALGGDSDLAL